MPTPRRALLVVLFGPLALAACSEPAAHPCDGVACSGRGFCVADHGIPYCGCLHGYHPVGLACLLNDAADTCEGILCSGHGECRVVGDDPVCDCEPGYRHLVDDRCDDIACDLLCVPNPAADADADIAADADADIVADADADAAPPDTPAEDASSPPVCGNGTVEPGEECDGAPPRSCTTSCGTTGSQVCIACRWETTCNPPSEACNGVDDDCDTRCDNGYACCRGASESCTTSCGSAGSRTCSSSCSWDACAPPGETCNGRDDDCDTRCDNGYTCCRGDSRSCTDSWGCSGTQTCTSSCGWGTCTVPTGCTDYFGAHICSGSDGLTTSGCPVSRCHFCTCSGGSWTGCSSCGLCPS